MTHPPSLADRLNLTLHRFEDRAAATGNRNLWAEDIKNIEEALTVLRLTMVPAAWRRRNDAWEICTEWFDGPPPNEPEHSLHIDVAYANAVDISGQKSANMSNQERPA